MERRAAAPHPDFLPWLRWVVAVAGVVAVLLVLIGLGGRRAWARRAMPVVLLGALLAGAGGSVAYAAETAATVHTGSIVSAGPSTGNEIGRSRWGRPAGWHPAVGRAIRRRPGAGGPGGQGGQGGGPGGSTTTSAALTSLLQQAGTRWSAAVVGSQSAASTELSSGTAVMAIGGWAAPTRPPPSPGSRRWSPPATCTGSSAPAGARAARGFRSVGSQITAWVTAHHTATTVGGTTVYDLTAPTS